MDEQTKAKFDFLKSINLDTGFSVAEFIKQKDLINKPGAYMSIVQDGQDTKNPGLVHDILDIYKRVYDYWRDKIFPKIAEQLSWDNEQQQIVSQFLNNPKFYSENMTPRDCWSFVHEGYNKYLPNVVNPYNGQKFRPLRAQNGNFSPIVGNNLDRLSEDFVHVFPFLTSDNKKCRLYLNLKGSNVGKVAVKFIDECEKINFAPYFKFLTWDNRIDNFLVYVSYKRAPDVINILTKIKNENPELFEGSQKINKFLVPINGFIGYGEEPEYKYSSFNKERAEAINDFKKEVIEPKIANIRKYIGNYSGTLTNSYGQVLNIRDYLNYRLTESFKETLRQTQLDIINRKYPNEFVQNNSVSSYIQFQNQLYNACKNDLPPSIAEQINKKVDYALQNLKEGKNIIKTHSIVVKTKRAELFPENSPEYLQNTLSSRGYLNYSIDINLDLEDKLFKVFNAYDAIYSEITDQNLKPYLQKHHVSSKYPAINTETEEFLNNFGRGDPGRN